MTDSETIVKAYLTIRRNSDGEIATSKEEWDFYGDFIWRDGNFSCDCNRADFFSQAINGPDDLNEDCGNTKYSIRLRAVDDGRLLYSDGDWPKDQPIGKAE